MPTPKDLALIADKKEKERMDYFQELYEKEYRIQLRDIFDSAEIEQTLSTKASSFSYSLKGAYGSLPLNSLLYSKNIVMICPNCIKGNVNLIKPYLDRDLLLPVLYQPLANYSSDFIEEVIKHPYIGYRSLNFFKKAQTCKRCIEEKPKTMPIACPHSMRNVERYDKPRDNIKKKISCFIKDESMVKDYCNTVDDAFSSLFPVEDVEYNIVKEIEEATRKKKFDRLEPLYYKAVLVNTLRLSESLGAIPEIPQTDITIINNTLESYKIPLNSYGADISDERMWTAHALGLDYDPHMPIEEYLDIILPRRKKVNALIQGFINNKEPSLHKSINDEIWDINKEIAGSKKIELLNYVTDFSLSNSGLIACLMIGGLLGYGSASVFAHGLESVASATGSLAMSVSGKVASKKGLTKKVQIPKTPTKTIEWIKEKVETQEEKALAVMLGKSLPTIQVWSLRRKFEKSKNRCK